LQRDLRKIDKTLPRSLRVAHKQIAESVATEGKRTATALGGVARKAAPAIKPRAEQRRARVLLDGVRYPYALGAEFGGGKYKKGNPTARGGYTSQFKPWRGNGSGAGYFLWPTIRQMSQEITKTYDQVVTDAIAAGPPVSKRAARKRTETGQFTK
jgi:hypothetical protein